MSTPLGNGVVAHAYLHQLCERACTSYVTEGLRAHGQRELVMTIANGPDPYQLMQTIVRFAQQGKIVDESGFTEFGPAGLFGCAHIRGVIYQRAWPMSDVPLPDGALAMIALVGHEMETAKTYGSLRVLARLGRAHRFFPTAVWCDVDRGPLFPPESNTMLDSVLLARFGEPASIAIEGTEVELRLPPSAQTMFASQLPPPDAAVGFLTTIAPGSDSCLVWSPGQQTPEAISLSDGAARRTSGCFVMFVPQQPADECNFWEDGFVCMLTDLTWARLRNALASGGAFTMPGIRSLTLTWT